MYSIRKRVIPILSLYNYDLVKTKKFKKPKYIGDPINAVKIFNVKEVDELAFIDITPLSIRSEPDFNYIQKITTECFIPLSYGGKIRTIDHIRKILSIGVEKVIINTMAVENYKLLKEACQIFGSSTIVASVDYKKDFWGRIRVFSNYGSKNIKETPEIVVKKLEDCGVGEILLNCISNDGMQNGYDLKVINDIASKIKIPLIACGGAASINDFIDGFKNGASAVAAGSKFVLNGKHNAVLITYLKENDINKLINL